MGFYRNNYGERSHPHAQDIEYTDNNVYQSPKYTMNNRNMYQSTESQKLNKEPTKEIRMVRRDGDEITEECEWLNDDGTVTKSITVKDLNNVVKHTDFYKMDKSGIVRKIDNFEQSGYVSKETTNPNKKYVWMDEFEKEHEEQALQKQRKLSSKYSILDSSGENVTHYGPHSNNVGVGIQNLTPEDKIAVFNDYKEKLILYGTNKLKRLLEKKIEENKSIKKYHLTEEEKQDVLEYGIKKLTKILEKHLENTRYMDMYLQESFGSPDVSSTPENTKDKKNRHISFSLQPGSEEMQSHQNTKELSKPLSFSIRPGDEVNTTPCSHEISHTAKENTILDRFKTFWKNHVTGEKHKEDSSRYTLPKYDNEDYYGSYNDDDYKDPESLEDTFKHMQKYIKKYLKNDKTFENSPVERLEQQEIADYALRGFYSTLKDAQDKKKLKQMLSLTNSFKERETKELIKQKELEKQQDERLKKKYYSEYDTDYDDEFDTRETFDRMHLRQREIAKDNEKYSRHLEEGRDKVNNTYTSAQNMRPVSEDINKRTLPSQQNVKDKKPLYYTINWPPISPRENNATESSKKIESKGTDFESFLSKINEAIKRKANSNSASSATKTQHNNFYKTNANSKSDYSLSPDKEYQTMDKDSILGKIQGQMKQTSNAAFGSSQHNLKSNCSYYDQMHPQIDNRSIEHKSSVRDGKSMSFHIKPQLFGTTNENSSRSPRNEQSNEEKLNKTSNVGGFFPWWFDQMPDTESFKELPLKVPSVEKSLLSDSFYNKPLIGGGGGVIAGSGGDFFSGPLLK